MTGNAKVRAAAAYALVLVAALSAPVAILGTWAQRHVVSTDGYVDTVGPLSSDLRVQRAVTDAVTDAVMTSVPTSRLLASLPPALAGTGQLTRTAARRIVHASVSEVVESSAFHALWVSANRSAQAQALAELRGADTRGAPSSHLVIDLDPVAEAVRQELVASGFTALRGVHFERSGRPATLLVPTGDLNKAGPWWSAFESSMTWLTPVLLVLAGVALAIAPRRRRVLLAEALALLASIGVTALVTAHGRASFGDQLQGLAAADAARAVGDALAGSIEHWLRALTVVAAALAVTALAALTFPARRSHVAH